MFIEQKIMLLMSEFLFTQPFTKVKHLVDSGIYAENTARDYFNKFRENRDWARTGNPRFILIIQKDNRK